MGNYENSHPLQNGFFHDKSDGAGGGVPWLAHQMSTPRPVVICGPSGSGKSTLLKYLMEEFEDFFGFSISHTTRKPRPGEKSGKDYYFVDVKDMENSIANGEFLEYTSFSGNLYGTSKRAVKRVLEDQGKICILDIEIEGVKNIKKTDLNPLYVFVKPPSIKDLEQRLRGRGTESEESLQKRLARAKEELRYGETPGNFDIVLVNDNAEETYKQLKAYLMPLCPKKNCRDVPSSLPGFIQKNTKSCKLPKIKKFIERLNYKMLYRAALLLLKK